MSPFHTYGAYFLSTLFCAMLWGASCVQMLFYFTRYVRDDRWLKIIVAIIFAMNTVQTALVAYGAYAYLVIQFGNFSFFEAALPASWAGFLLSAIVCVLVQGIFVVQAQRRSRVLLSLWVLLGLFELGTALYCVVTKFRNDGVIIISSTSLKGVLVSFLAVTAFVDIAIAFSFTKSLYNLNRHIVTVATSEMIRHIITLSILSGIWTALFALLSMITYLCFPDTATYVVFDLPLCSLYCNTLLANLNSRRRGTIPSLRETSTFRAATGPIVLSTIIGSQLEDGQFDEERDSIGTMDWK